MKKTLYFLSLLSFLSSLDTVALGATKSKLEKSTHGVVKTSHTPPNTHKTAKVKKKTVQRPLSEQEIVLNNKVNDLFQHYRNSSASLEQDTLTTEAIIQYISKRHQDISTTDARIISKEIVRQGKIYQIDPKFAAAIISAESGFNKTAQSRSGAKGLGQLMDSTYKNLGVNNPYDIQENVQATLEYLRNIIIIWDGNSLQLSYAIASYLRGPDAVQRSGGKFSHFTLYYLDLILKKYMAIYSIENELKITHL